MLSPSSPSSSNNDNNDPKIIDSLYDLCKEKKIENIRNILPFIDDINIINTIQTSTDSTCLHVTCYDGHRDVVQILLEYEALHSIRNLRHNLTHNEEVYTDDIKQLFVEQQKLFSNNDYNYLEWSMVGNDLLGKRHKFHQTIDLYKTYNNHHLVSKLLAEVIHYNLNEYLINKSNNTGNSEDQIIRKQIETIKAYFKEAIEKQDYLTYFIRAYTLSTSFYKMLNKHLTLYILQYFDKMKGFSSNYRLVNCLIPITALLIYHPNLPQYRYQGLCYQGMRITQNDLDQYQLNQYMLNHSFLSTSIDREAAEMFAGKDQQSKMRHTSKDHCELQHSCLCQYLIKQNSTAINIESLSTRSDENEILIFPFTVFKVIAIKRNYLDNPTASISIGIELEECENPNDNKNESERSDTLRTLSFSSFTGDTSNVEEDIKIQQRKHLLYRIIRFLVFAILLVLTFTFIFLFVFKKNSTTTSTPEKDNDVGRQLLPGCPNILNRSSWKARPYTSHGNLILPVTHIVIHNIAALNPTMNQQDCINNIKLVQDYQMNKLGWFDIGYSFILCNGNDDHLEIYSGRGWKYIGAHCIGYNSRSLGIGIMGNYTNIKSLNAFKSLIQCGIIINDIIKNFTLVGHKSSTNIYKYYLKYFANDTDLQYNNQASSTPVFCQ